MKFFKLTLRAWITVTSLSGFLFGWVFLAHSPKPIDKTVSATNSISAQLAPVPSLDALVSQSNNQQAVNVQSSQFRQNFSPMMRTGGS